MNALQHLETILDMANGADECPHVVFPHVTEIDGYAECEDMALVMLQSILQHLAAGEITDEIALSAAGHVVVMVAALGYAIGTDATAETFQTVEIPDTLAALDFLDPVRGEN